MSKLFKAERDTIAGLGLLASTCLRFDPELKSGDLKSHARGFNVHCLVIDNIDGEVLALECNRIHIDDNPLQHAEQLGVRVALEALQQKRPRPAGMPVDKYYKSMLFMGPGTDPDDFSNVGCTLYNTFDPCGMCAVTLLVAYMKRIAYLFDDVKFEAVYEHMRTYFGKRQSVKESLSLVDADGSSPIAQASGLIHDLRAKVRALTDGGTQLVGTLDHCRDDLEQSLNLLISVKEEHLKTVGGERTRNARTLMGLKQFCNIN
jgi:tRNA(Arg) A34 adenosine deaminase TadA